MVWFFIEEILAGSCGTGKPLGGSGGRIWNVMLAHGNVVLGMTDVKSEVGHGIMERGIENVQKSKWHMVIWSVK